MACLFFLRYTHAQTAFITHVMMSHFEQEYAFATNLVKVASLSKCAILVSSLGFLLTSLEELIF